MFDLRFHYDVHYLNHLFYEITCKEYCGIYQTNIPKYEALIHYHKTYQLYIYHWKQYFTEKPLY